MLLYTIFTGKKIIFIKPSPSRTRMIHYGGYFTVEDYEKEVESLDTLQYREIEDNVFTAMCESYVNNIAKRV